MTYADCYELWTFYVCSNAAGEWQTTLTHFPLGMRSFVSTVLLVGDPVSMLFAAMGTGAIIDRNSLTYAAATLHEVGHVVNGAVGNPSNTPGLLGCRGER